MKKVFENVTKSIKDVSDDVTRTRTENSQENNKALTILNGNCLEIMKDRGILSSYLLSPLSKINKPEHTSHLKLVKHLDSNRVNDILINKTIQITLYYNLLTFCATDKKLEIQGELSKMIANKNYIVDLAKLSDEKRMYESTKEMYFDQKKL